MTQEPVHIIGAGIAGLTLALGLLRAGISVQVHEQAPELGEIGAGLSISPNASLGLEYLGMLDFLQAESNKPSTNYVFHWQTDEELVAHDRTKDLSRFSGEYFQIHRADFHQELVRRVNALSSDCIRLGQALNDAKPDGDALSLHFENGSSVRAEWVVGADGIKSVLRNRLFDDQAPEFTGLMAWRGLIPAKDVDPKFVDPVSRVWAGPGRTFVTYPIRKGELVNVVAFAQAKGWTEEGWAVRAQPGELEDAFDGFCAPVQHLIEAVPQDELFRWGLFSRAPLKSLESGRAALIGDAGHPMLPWFGQGASSAIEDSVVLARCAKDSASMEECFAKYNSTRFERVHFLQSESNAGTERMQGFDPYVLRDAPRRDEDALGLFSYNPATVAIA